jgi:hypothetical protein
LDPERVKAIKDRLQTAIDELKVNVDENRFEQELIYYLEKTRHPKKSTFNKSPGLFLRDYNGTVANGRK